MPRRALPVCVTVTLVDGLVLARSAFHHSINYRSVVVYGTGTEVTDVEEKRAAMAAVVEHIVPGRGVDARPPTSAELRATRVVRVPLDEASAKIRTGGPKDDAEDLALPVWAGQLPLRIVPSAPIADGDHPVPIATPGYLTDYARPPARSGRRPRPAADRHSVDFVDGTRADRGRLLHRPAVRRQPGGGGRRGRFPPTPACSRWPRR